MQNKYLEGEFTKLTKIFSLSVVTKFPALQVQYVGSKAFSKLGVAAGGSITIYADDTDGATTLHQTIGIDSAGDATTDGVIDLAAPHADVDTMGELSDWFNANADFRTFLIGVDRTHGTTNELDTLSSASIATTNGLTLFLDEVSTDGPFSGFDVGFAITNQKFTTRPTGGWSTKQVGWVTDQLVENVLNYLDFTVTNTNSGDIRIYSCDDIGKVAGTQIWSGAYTTAVRWINGVATNAATLAHDPSSPWIKAIRGQRLLIYFDASTAAITAANIVAHSTSKHVVGGDVQGANYTGLI